VVYPSRLAQEGEHLRMTAVFMWASAGVAGTRSDMRGWANPHLAALKRATPFGMESRHMSPAFKARRTGET
jgi:hypothetical protein